MNGTHLHEWSRRFPLYQLSESGTFQLARHHTGTDKGYFAPEMTTFKTYELTFCSFHRIEQNICLVGTSINRGCAVYYYSVVMHQVFVNEVS